jgi:hypothetical protein
MPVDGRFPAELVAHHYPHPIALPDPEFRAGHYAVIGPDGGGWMAVARQLGDRLLRRKPEFLRPIIRNGLPDAAKRP